MSYAMGFAGFSGAAWAPSISIIVSARTVVLSTTASRPNAPSLTSALRPALLNWGGEAYIAC